MLLQSVKGVRPTIFHVLYNAELNKMVETSGPVKQNNILLSPYKAGVLLGPDSREK